MLLRYHNKILVSTTNEEEQGIKPKQYGRKIPAALAALGINQLRKIDAYNELRRQTAKKWDRWCESTNHKKPLIITDSIPVYLRYPVLVDKYKKQNLLWAKKELGFIPGVWFRGCLHPTDRKVEGCPNAERAVAECINLPGLE